MSVDLSPIGGAGAQFFDNNGVPLSGGKLYTYATGTTTPKACYTSGSGNVPHSNPIILDSAGRVPGGEIWLTSGEGYKFVLETPTGILLGTWDNIYGYTTGSADASTEVQTATAGQTLFVLNSMAYTPGSNTLGVYIDGVNQVVNNSYIETNNTSVTFVSGLHEGAVVKFININIASTDANVVTYEPGFTGSVATTVADKLQQYVSVKDFGAVGDGVTDDAVAIQAAIDAVASIGGGRIFMPTGTYIVGTTLYMDDYVYLQGENQNATVIQLKNSTNANIIEQKVGSVGLGMGLLDVTVDGNQANNTQGGVYLVGATDERGPSWHIERVLFTHCRNSVMPSGVKAAFYLGGNTWHVVRDVDVQNNDYAQIAYWHGAADSPVDGLFIGTNGRSFGSTSYGLFVTGATNFFTDCYFGGTQSGPQVHITNGSGFGNKFIGCVIDNAGANGVEITSGAKQNQFIGCSIGNSSYSDGGTYFLVRNEVDESRTMFIGVRFYSNYLAAPATYGYYEDSGIDCKSILIGCQFTGTWVTGPVFLPATSTTQVLGCEGYDITSVKTLEATKINVLGPRDTNPPSTSTVPLARFNNGEAVSLWAGAYNYTYAWLQAIQDDGSNLLKTLYLNPLGGNVWTGGSIYPGADNAYSIGTGGGRWSVIYAATGTINTSDQREKQDIAALEAAELRVAAKLKTLVKKFRFKDAVKLKGDGARIHVGVIAQEVIAAFEAEGLDPMRYGVVCYDEWDADDDKPAGNRYGVRYEELLSFIIAGL